MTVLQKKKTEDNPTAHLSAEDIEQIGVELDAIRKSIVDGEGGGTVTFALSKTVVESPGGVPLLETGEGAGVLMPSGCRMGICFSCVLNLREGAVRDLRDGQITTAEPGDTIPIQTCISAAAGPCTIDH